MEKLGQLRRSNEWDLIVVDTPPSRSALDFLDAPERLGRFLDGRLIRLLTAPVKAGRPFGRVLNAGLSVMTGTLTKLLGAQVLRDAQTFVTAFDTMFGGFRERADATYKLLQAPGTSFLVVATPEPDALREASYFVERLDEERMPLAGLILNRVHDRIGTGPAGAESARRGAVAGRLSAARSLAAAETLEAASNGGTDTASSAGTVSSNTVSSNTVSSNYVVAAAALRLHAERMNLGERERRVAGSFISTHPAVPVIEVPALPEDVHDLAGLRRIGEAFVVGFHDGSRP